MTRLANGNVGHILSQLMSRTVLPPARIPSRRAVGARACFRSALVAVAVAAAAVAFGAAPAHAQFRNQGVFLPAGGYFMLGTWDRILHGGSPAAQNLQIPDAAPQSGWNLNDEPQIGAGYFHAIGYDLWWDFTACIGFWNTVIDLGATNTPVITVLSSGGLRYNFLEERVRPFVAVHLDYLQVIAFPDAGATAPVPGNGFLGNTPFFIGVRPAGGVEWIFGDEIGAMIEAGPDLFLVPDKDRGLGGLFLPAAVVRGAVTIYF